MISIWAFPRDPDIYQNLVVGLSAISFYAFMYYINCPLLLVHQSKSKISTIIHKKDAAAIPNANSVKQPTF